MKGICQRGCLVTRRLSLSLSMKIFAQRKTSKRKWARRTSPCFFLFPMVSCASSPVTQVSRSPLRLSRSQCQRSEVKTTVMRSLANSRFCLEIKTAERETVGQKTLKKKSASCGEKWLEFEKFLKQFLFFFTSVRVFFFARTIPEK